MGFAIPLMVWESIHLTWLTLRVQGHSVKERNSCFLVLGPRSISDRDRWAGSKSPPDGEMEMEMVYHVKVEYSQARDVFWHLVLQ